MYVVRNDKLYGYYVVVNRTDFGFAVLTDSRDVHRGAAAAAVAAAVAGSGAAAAEFFKGLTRRGSGSGRFLKIHRGSGTAAAAFFSRTLKKCMNLIEF